MIQLTAENIKQYFANSPQITFEVTKKCNLKCVYCGYGNLYGNKDNRNDADMEYNNAISLLSLIKELWKDGYNTVGPGVLHISFYGGEPLLNVELIKCIVAYIEKEYKQFEKTIVYSMTTNAMLLKHHIDYLVEKDFNLLISIDGDEAANSYRINHSGKPSFKTLIENINFVQTRYPIYFQNRVEFNSVLTNRSSYKGIQKFLHSKYGKIPTISEINNVGINPEKVDLFKELHKSINDDNCDSPKVIESGSESFHEDPTFELAAKYFSMYSPYFFFDYNDLLYLNRVGKTPTGTCLPFTKKIFLSVDGKIMPCERIGFKYFLGEMRNGFADIDFDRIANIYNEYFSKANKYCSKCKDYRGCLHCLFNTGQLESSNYICNYFVSQKNYDSMLEEVYNFIRSYPEAYEYIMSKYEII